MAFQNSHWVTCQVPWGISGGINVQAMCWSCKGPRFVPPGKMKSKGRHSFFSIYSGGRIVLPAVLNSGT